MKNCNYILVDRSSSMFTRWSEAVKAVDEYINDLDSGRVTLATFDNDFNGRQSEVKIEKLAENIKRKNAKDLLKSVMPRGSTPLYDAVGKACTEILAAKPKTAVLLVITDGYENASTEHTKESVAELVKKMEKRGYEVIYVGADFKDTTDAIAMGLNVSMKATVLDTGAYVGKLKDIATTRNAYASSGTAMNVN